MYYWIIKSKKSSLLKYWYVYIYVHDFLTVFIFGKASMVVHGFDSEIVQKGLYNRHAIIGGNCH